MHTGKLVLIIGPSGVGKSVILKKLKQKHPEFFFPRSATTRERRKGESDDLYYFVDDKKFDGLLQNNEILEHAVVHGGARYGTLNSEILKPIEEGKTVIREVDVQGFEGIRTNPLFSGENPTYRLQSIFILPENREQLIKRIKNRAPISEEELQRRIKSMDVELSKADLCTAKVLNIQGRLTDTINQVENAIGR